MQLFVVGNCKTMSFSPIDFFNVTSWWTQTLRLGVFTFLPDAARCRCLFLSRCGRVPTVLTQNARFANPVPLSTSLQDGRCYHVSLCPQLKANLRPSLSSRTFNCHPNAVYDKPIAHVYCVNIILAIDSHFCLAERCEFSCPGPTTVCQQAPACV